MPERERVIWHGEVVTVVGRTLKNMEIRDGYGFTHTVRKRDIKPLDADDPRRTFNATEAS